MEGDLLDKGITLMVAGMGTVFAFLTVLVIAMTIMSTTLRAFGGMNRVDTAGDGASDEEVAAISAAIAEHRRR